MELDVLVIGEILIELTSPEPFAVGQSVRLGVSGDALNAATAAAAAGASVALLTRVGDDELGELILREVSAAGVETGLIRMVDAPQGVYFAVHDPSGARQFVYARRGSAASTLHPSDLAGVARPRAVLTSGITAAISPSAKATVFRAAQLADVFIYDPNFRPRLTSVESARRVLRRLAPSITIVTPSAPNESQALLGTTDARAAARVLRDWGVRYVAVTCGSDGVMLDDGLSQVDLPPVPPRAIVDQTGAGDVFVGTVAARYALGDDLVTAVQLAGAAASISLESAGGTPERASVDALRDHLRRASS
jgi:2-dehydro-3-deoxygluconokinase